MNDPADSNEFTDLTAIPDEDPPRLRLRSEPDAGAAGASSGGAYHLLRNGQRQGPMTRDAVVTLIQAALVDPLDLGWIEGASGWRPLGEMFPGITPLVRPIRHDIRPGEGGSASEREEPLPFARCVIQSLTYPFRGDGLIILSSGALFLFLISFANGILGIFSILVGIPAMGYLFGALQLVVQASAQGEAELPKWPELNHAVTDLVRPVKLWIGSLLFCFAPALMAGFIAGQRHSDTWTGLAGAFALGGGLYCPMALLAVAMTDSTEALNPILVYQSVRAVWRDYLLLVGVLALAAATYFLGSLAMKPMADSVVGSIWLSANSVFFWVIFARLLGVFYHSNKERLGWF